MADEADQTYGHLTKIIRVIDVMLNYQGGAEIRHSFVQATFSQIGLANIPLVSSEAMALPDHLISVAIGRDPGHFQRIRGSNTG